MSESGIRAGTVFMSEAKGPEEVRQLVKSSVWTVAQVGLGSITVDKLGAIVIG